MDTIYLHAWAAGLLDADGTITIKRTKRGRGLWNYIPLIQLTQVATFKGKNNTKRIQQLFGGAIHKGMIRRSEGEKRQTPILSWQATSRTAIECIKAISPFMTGKSRQAKLLIEYIEKFHGDDYVFHRLTSNEMDERARYFRKMRSFQEKGFSP